MPEPNAERVVATTLVVDDDPMVCGLAGRCLEQVGVRTIAALSAQQALEAVDKVTPELVILDVRMPGVDGLELCRQLRQRPDTGDVPILMMTGLEDPDTLEQAYEAGATDFITKPVTPTMLQHRARYLLRSGGAFRQLRRSQARLAAAQRIAHLGNWQLDPDDGSLRWSDELFRVFGMAPRDKLTVADLLACVHPEDAPSVEKFLQTAAEGSSPEPIQYRLRHEDGSITHVYQQAELGSDPACGSRWVFGTLQDVTRRTEDEARIRFLAFRDTLTGLPNRRLLSDRLAGVMAAAQRQNGRAAVLHVDVDRFSSINEGYGHRVGDHLLREIADRLAGCVRASDTVARHAQDRPTVSRLGGDEFVVLLQDIGHGLEPAHVAGRILAELGRPYQIDDAEILISVSIGIAVHPDDGEDGEVLIRRAGTAVNHARAQGGNSFLFYDARMNSDVAARLELASRLHGALEHDEFRLVYQPIFRTASRTIGSVEALLRWDDSQEGGVQPSTFVPVAEETGLIVPLGDWVIDRACAQWRDWLDSGVGPVEIAINVSARQFRDPELVERTRASIERHAVDPSCLRFELTEGTLMSSSALTVELIGAIRQLGVGLAVDDFGTGYSSLGYLRRFPAETLKIDRSFVSGVPEDQESCRLVAAIVAMAHKMRLRVVAEGVETESQLRFLQALDCEQVQGFLLARPAPGDDLTPLLRQRLERPNGSRVLPFRKRGAS